MNKILGIYKTKNQQKKNPTQQEVFHVDQEFTV